MQIVLWTLKFEMFDTYNCVYLSADYNVSICFVVLKKDNTKPNIYNGFRRKQKMCYADSRKNRAYIDLNISSLYHLMFLIEVFFTTR